MVSSLDILWFKNTFGKTINDKFSDSLFTLDFLTAIACQETGYVWSKLKKEGLALEDILKLCVGDTLDSPKRRAFPKNKAELLSRTNGDKMFDIAHDYLVAMAEYIPGYKNVSKKAHKFCRGYGIFQYDLQHFKTDPEYFLNEKWCDFDEVLIKLEEELDQALRIVVNKGGISAGTTEPLTKEQLSFIGIAYNTGNNFKLSKGLKQGHRVNDKYYGEYLYEYIERAESVKTANEDAPLNESENTLITNLEYPGSTISRTSNTNKYIVKKIQERLEELDFGPVGVDGDFGVMTEHAIMAFQALNDDENGMALNVDGEVGELTWDALFQDRSDIEDPVPDLSGIPSDKLAFIKVANAQIGVKQSTRGSETGPMVDAYIYSTGLRPGKSSYWCMAFVYWCAMKTCNERNIINNFPKTAHVKTSWNRAKQTGIGAIVERGEATSDTVKPGMVFYISTGSTSGHTGIVTKVSSTTVHTIEGNTNEGGSSNGYGVFARTRKIKSSNLMGYIDFWGS